MALTEERNTRELLCGAPTYEYVRTAAAAILAGGLVAQNADGKAVPASDSAGLIVLGRAENSAAAGEEVRARTGAYLYSNGSGAEALDAAAIGAVCYAVDDETVGAKGGTNAVPAGIVLDALEDGVAVLTGAAVSAALAAASKASDADSGSEPT